MTTPSDVAPAPETPAAVLGNPPIGEDAVALSPSQEINARRARVENSELLQHLRGL